MPRNIENIYKIRYFILSKNVSGFRRIFITLKMVVYLFETLGSLWLKINLQKDSLLAR